MTVHAREPVAAVCLLAAPLFRYLWNLSTFFMLKYSWNNVAFKLIMVHLCLQKQNYFFPTSVIVNDGSYQCLLYPTFLYQTTSPTFENGEVRFQKKYNTKLL